MRDIEHHIQCVCVKWFRLKYPRLAQRLIAIPNGGARDLITGARLKAEGVVAGVADLALLIPRKGYGALFVEMKTDKGRQSESQKQWAAQLGNDYLYIVCRSLDQFIKIVTDYLHE
jgi:hypothetical protein